MLLKELNLIFNKNKSKIYEYLEELIEQKDYKAVIYLDQFINNYADKNLEKLIELLQKYLNVEKDIGLKGASLALKERAFLFLLNYKPENKLIDTLLDQILQEEQDLDVLYSIFTNLVKKDVIPEITQKFLYQLYLKINNSDLPNEVKQIYLKNLLSTLKENKKIIELEDYLNLLYKENKKYWVVENLVELYFQKEEYEKLLNVFINLITSAEFVKIWSESLGIINKTIEQIIDEKEIIPKIIYHLPNINSLTENFPKNVYKIYQSILNSYEELNEEDKEKFEKSFYNFINLISSIQKIDENLITKIVINFISKNPTTSTLEKIQSSLKNENIFNKVVGHFSNNIAQFAEFFVKNPNLIDSSILLNQLNLNDYVKIYQINPQFIKNINQDTIRKLLPQSIDNLINLLIHVKEYQEIDKLLNLLVNSQIDIENLSLTTKILLKLNQKDYFFVLLNITDFLSYPEVIKYVYQNLKPSIPQDKLNRIFVGIFLYYMDTEMEIEEELLKFFKNELKQITSNSQ